LTAETTYYYRIRAVNTCGTSGNSGTITYATVTTAALPPTITLTDPNPLAVQGGNSTNLIYIATTNNPNEYSIVYDATALGQGFEDVTLALPPSPITLSVPPTALLGTYNGILTVKNSITALTSVNYPITITITDVTNHSLYNCTSCHITHNAPGSSLTAVSGNALLCQSCHISTGAASNKPLVNANNIALNPSTGNSHAWDVLAVNNTKETVRPPIGSEMELRVIDNKIICSTCHNQHNNGNAGNPYLRIDNTNDAMCKVCHAARNVGLYTDPTPGKGSHPVGVTYDDTDTRFNNTQTLVTNGSMVQCSTCHGVHDVDNSLGLAANGNLLRTTNDVSLCTDCHVPMLHNGMDCLDCHQVHNTDKSNLYMIKSTITTPGSGDKNVVFTSLTGANNFADGDGIDGVCEVCHQTTKHFRNSDNLAGAPDQLHTSQGLNISDQNCTNCHDHGNSFAGGDCVTCHQDNTTYPYLTGNWNISDGHVAHTTKYSFDCSTCHFNRGSGSNPDTHIDGTVDINFNATGLAKRNGNDTNTPSWNGTTCSSIYCHSNGKTADRGQDGTHFWGDGTAGGGIPFRGDALSYSTTPNWNSIGSITACNSCHGGPDALPPGPTYDITAGGIYDSNSTAEMPNTGSHGPLQSQHASGNMNDWGGGTTQCFWCHDTDDRTADFAGAVKKQGTYGTSLHVDGQTHFKMGWTTQGGTGNVDVPRMELPSAHCQSKTCWGG
jgi:predicted CxxxxCH...CXXCH cytochrome family protein